MRKVTMVVPVLMINCQVSEKPKTGPVAAQMITMIQQIMNATAWPVAWATASATWVNHLFHSWSANCHRSVATLASVMLGNTFGDQPMFVALGQTLAILGAAIFAWWLGR
jgi:hypothetical protein